MTAAAEGFAALAELALDRFPSDAARVLEAAPPERAAALLGGRAPERVREALERATADAATQILAAMDPATAARHLEAAAPERGALLLARLDPGEREPILARLPAGLARELRALAEWPPQTAGALMDPRVTAFAPRTPVRDALERLRALGRPEVRDLFLLDEEGRLTGLVPLQAVALAEPEAPLASLARPAPRVVGMAPREEVLELLERQDVSSLAVVDVDDRLLGVLRQEQLVAAAQQEASADLATMVGASPNERALSPPFFAVRKRLPWLQVNLLTAFLAAAVVGLFEETIARITALAVLLPVVAGQSGNTGAQALAVTMRGLALREVRVRHWPRVAGKELLVGFANGVAVALTTSLAVYAWSRSGGLALVIGSSMVLSMTAAGLAGASIPVALTALRQDPAQSSSIILTTVTDVVGFASFLGIATLLVTLLEAGG